MPASDDVRRSIRKTYVLRMCMVDIIVVIIPLYCSSLLLCGGVAHIVRSNMHVYGSNDRRILYSCLVLYSSCILCCGGRHRCRRRSFNSLIVIFICLDHIYMSLYTIFGFLLLLHLLNTARHFCSRPNQQIYVYTSHHYSISHNMIIFSNLHEPRAA